MIHLLWNYLRYVEHINARWWTPLFLAAFVIGVLCMRGFGSRTSN